MWISGISTESFNMINTDIRRLVTMTRVCSFVIQYEQNSIRKLIPEKT